MGKLWFGLLFLNSCNFLSQPHSSRCIEHSCCHSQVCFASCHHNCLSFVHSLTNPTGRNPNLCWKMIKVNVCYLEGMHCGSCRSKVLVPTGTIKKFWSISLSFYRLKKKSHTHTQNQLYKSPCHSLPGYLKFPY